MSVVYILCGAMGVVILVFRNEAASEEYSAAELLFIGAALVVLGLVLSLAYGAAPFLPRVPWVWVYHLVLIGLAMTSACCLPICVPLLIWWIKPDSRAYFGRS